MSGTPALQGVLAWGIVLPNLAAAAMANLTSATAPGLPPLGDAQEHRVLRVKAQLDGRLWQWFGCWLLVERGSLGPILFAICWRIPDMP
jgi:hypothetical protein